MNNHTFLNPLGQSYYDGSNLGGGYNENNNIAFIPGNTIRDANADIRVIKKIIGRVGVPGCDFNFAAAADHVEQDLDLGAIIPGKAFVTNIQVVCIETVVGVADFNISVGLTAGGTDFLALNSCATLNVVLNSINPVLPGWAAAYKVFFGGDPTNNTWNLMTAGKWAIYITYQDFSKV